VFEIKIEVKKNAGAYYTCEFVADYIAKWAIDKPDICLLEPSFGDGIFIRSAIARFAELGNSCPNIIGIELMKTAFDAHVDEFKNLSKFQMDFIDYRATDKIDAIIGNPPYVSLKNLESSQREKTMDLINSYGVKIQNSSSLWMPFIVHSTEMLEIHGKLGFVLPYEITYVRYAFELWKYLSNNYGKITVCRIYQDFFPEVDVETVLLLAERKGESTNAISYNVYETVHDLGNNFPMKQSEIYINDILNLDKPFERELIPTSVISVLDELRKKNGYATLLDDCKFKIGYVAGDKDFFHPSESIIQNFSIRQENIKKSLTNAKQINSNECVGVETGNVSVYSSLFYPITIGDGEKRYIEYGERKDVDKKYKCKVRKPWYLVPDLKIPDVVLTVFGDVPKLLINNGNFCVSNSLLSGFSKVKNCKELVCRWYNSLTLLSVETLVHSLGGGTLVLIPGETDKLEVISNFPQDKIECTYEQISNFAKNNPIEKVYSYGDEIVLKSVYNFSDETISKLRNAISILQNWRNMKKRRRQN